MNNAFDTYFYHLINQQLTADWLDFLMVKFSDKLFWIPLYAVVIFFLYKQFGKQSLLILFFAGLSVVMADRLTSGYMKPLIKRERPCHVVALSPRVLDPCHETGSMPSSHAANHFAIAIFFIGIFGMHKKTLTTLWLLWAASIAYSRVYCGVHYPTDVLVGGALGALIGFICLKLYRFTNSKMQWN